MPDKKITQLPGPATAAQIANTDVLPLVGNTATVPANYKAQVKDFLSAAFGPVSLTMTANTTAGNTGVQMTAFSNVAAGAVATRAIKITINGDTLWLLGRDTL